MPGSQGEEHLPDLNVLMQEADARAAATVTSVTNLSDGQLLILGLFVAAWEVYRGVCALIERRLAEEALMLSRTLLEDAARLMWFAGDPPELEERALRYSWTSTMRERSLARAARANGWGWAEDMFAERSNWIARTRKKLRAAGRHEDPDSFPDTSQLLAELKESRLYYWYVRASNSIHSGIVGISARISPSEDPSESNFIPLRSPPDETARVGIMAAEFFLPALEAASRLLPWGGADEVRRFRDGFSPRAETLFTKITGKSPQEAPVGPDS